MQHHPNRFRRDMREIGRAKGTAQQHQRPRRGLIPFAIRARCSLVSVGERPRPGAISTTASHAG